MDAGEQVRPAGCTRSRKTAAARSEMARKLCRSPAVPERVRAGSGGGEALPPAALGAARVDAKRGVGREPARTA